MAYRILYVEDARPFQRILQKMLEDIGEVVIAPTTDRGWEMLGRETFHLVICDFMFPEGDAFPLLHRIRQQHSPTHLPVIMLTSAADRMTFGRFHGVGVNAAVRKPPEVGPFRDLVFKMLRRPWVERPEFVSGEVQLLSWRTGDHAFVYCANLGVLTDAATKAEALRLMHERIGGVLAGGATCPAVIDANLTAYVPPTSGLAMESRTSPAS